MASEWFRKKSPPPCPSSLRCRALYSSGPSQSPREASAARIRPKSKGDERQGHHLLLTQPASASAEKNKSKTPTRATATLLHQPWRPLAER